MSDIINDSNELIKILSRENKEIAIYTYVDRDPIDIDKRTRRYSPWLNIKDTTTQITPIIFNPKKAL
ncbi:MAG TPA: hypothetical protein ENG87_05770 [Candidatus Pacearchaeota archaeon]|nr:hypothetical protein BMS3Abin17_00517 [archaeon BMS3Abin17]HDK42863.1 hypothetical protein [Candidatus Pacearchaeota archaeon]HDZ61111.1 hypothetical protein [Candidatus Pacearchaeota archaeon]